MEYDMEREKHQVVLTFVLPLAGAQPLSGQKYILSTFDPTYYIDMSYDKDSDVRLGQAISRKCRISVYTPMPNEQALSFAQSLGKEDVLPEDVKLGK